MSDAYGNMTPRDVAHESASPYWIEAGTNRLYRTGGDMGYNADGTLAVSNGHTFEYTAEGMLRGIDNRLTGSYVYNAQGQRTLAVRHDQAPYTNYEGIAYVYFNGQVMADWRYGPEVGWQFKWTDYIYANGQKIASVDSNPSPAVTHYYLTDHLGTNQMQLSSTGGTEWQGYFTPFGQQITNGATTNYIGLDTSPGPRDKFTGKERDSESGLDYSGARMYASSIGRFTTPDPSGLRFANPASLQSLNLYSYVLNNPMRFVDPTGLWHCVWNSYTGDQDDPYESGGASEDDCDDQGGSWTRDENDPWPNAPILLDVDVVEHSDGETSVSQRGALVPSKEEQWVDELFEELAEDTGWFPEVCSVSGNIRFTVPGTPLRAGAAMDDQGNVSFSASARQAGESGGSTPQASLTGRAGLHSAAVQQQVAIPIPGTPVAATYAASPFGGRIPTEFHPTPSRQ